MDKEFVPFGEEWEAEVMKLPKKVIIGLYRNVCLENNKNIPLDAEVKPACETLKIIDEMIREWEESTFDISVKQALTELKRRLEKQ